MTPRHGLGALCLLGGLGFAAWMGPSPAAARDAVVAAAGQVARPGVARPKKPAVRKGTRAAPRTAAKSTAQRGVSPNAPKPPPAVPSVPLETRIAPLPAWENRPDWKPLATPFLYPLPEQAPDS